MWLITTDGFYSAVQHNTDPNILVVRSRTYADAFTLACFLDDQGKSEDAKVIYYETSDYPWRVFVPRETWVGFCALAAHHIDYGNFKDAVAKRQGYERASVYSSVWATLLRLQHTDPALKGTSHMPMPAEYGDEDEWLADALPAPKAKKRTRR